VIILLIINFQCHLSWSSSIYNNRKSVSKENKIQVMSGAVSYFKGIKFKSFCRNLFYERDFSVNTNWNEILWHNNNRDPIFRQCSSKKYAHLSTMIFFLTNKFIISRGKYNIFVEITEITISIISIICTRRTYVIASKVSVRSGCVSFDIFYKTRNRWMSC
jgi:hypothetical protein